MLDDASSFKNLTTNDNIIDNYSDSNIDVDDDSHTGTQYPIAV